MNSEAVRQLFKKEVECDHLLITRVYLCIMSDSEPPKFCEACVASLMRASNRHEMETQTDDLPESRLDPGSSDEAEFNLSDEYQEDGLDHETHGDLQGDSVELPDSGDEMEFEYEPAISLSSLEFARHASILSESQCILCGLDYETGKRCFVIVVHFRIGQW